MKSAMNYRRLLADVLHNVDLAAVGPMNSIDVITQHPECRPDALAKRNLDSCFEAAIGLAELVLREHSGRGVGASYVVSAGKSFFYRFDDQRTVFKMRVCSAARIGFEFVVTPTLPANIK